MSEETYNAAINKIKTATHGEEVRQAIVDAIDESYRDIKLSGGDAELVDIRNGFDNYIGTKAGDTVRRIGQFGTVESPTLYYDIDPVIFPLSHRCWQFRNTNEVHASTSSAAYTSPIFFVKPFTQAEALVELKGGSDFLYVIYWDENFNLLFDLSINGTANPEFIKAGDIIDIPEDAWYMAVMSTEKQSLVKGLIRLKNTQLILEKANMEPILGTIGHVKISAPYSESGYIGAHGDIFGVDTKSKMTHYIDVLDFDSYRCVNLITKDACAIAFYDENLNFMQDVSIVGDSTLNPHEGSIPEGVRYLKASYFNSSSGNNDKDIDKMYVEVWNESYYNSSLEKRLLNEIDSTKNEEALRGTNILIFGDSITDCTNISIDSNNATSAYTWDSPSNSYDGEGFNMWPKLINDNYDVNEIRCYAKSGAHYGNFEYGDETNHRQLIQYQIDVAFNDLSNPNGVFKDPDFVPDIVIFACGTNDGPNASGSYDETMAKTVYKDDGKTIDVNATISALDASIVNDAIRLAYLRIKNKFPLAMIFVVIPIQRTSDERIFSKTNEDIRKMAERYGCVVIDGSAIFGIVPEGNVYNGYGVTLKDGLHPNKEGQLLFARGVIKAIESHYMPLNTLKNYGD